ncbi:MAG: hypothetical protein V2B18_14605 [Pseudomonadota bacterium]
MKRLLMVVLSVLLIGAFAVPAFAWEFSMKGEQEWRYRYFTRNGPEDLFGKGSDIGLAGQNIYGHVTGALAAPQAVTAPSASPALLRIVRGGFSFAGPDAYYNDSRLTLRPEIRVNSAIRSFGVYNIGGYRNKYRQWNDVAVAGAAAQAGVGTPPFERYYVHQTSPNAYDTAAIGSWEQFRFTVQSPWCIWSLGIKDFPFGVGATLSHNVRAESFFTVVPYGPLRIMSAIWSAQNALNAGWGVNPDPDLKPWFYQALALQYVSGPVDVGGQFLLQKLHVKKQYQGLQATVGAPGPAAPAGAQGYDRDLLVWIFYGKYNNGRFFANAEYAWFNMDKRWIGAAPSFIEANHWFAEGGVYAGPAKLTLMAASASGSVLNNGNASKSYQPWVINYQAMQPYEWLMFSTYGGGNQQFGGILATDDGTGQMGDAFAYAGRLDYAVASNLNVWGSYIWAHRLESAGFAFGGVRSDGTGITGATAVTGVRDFAANAGRAAVYPGTYPYGFVSDGFIGWEVNAGVDWKLLENLNMTMRWAYWQPGEFFREAYQAFVGGVDNSVLSQRSSIQAFQGSLIVAF